MLNENVKASIVSQTRSKFSIAVIKEVNLEVKSEKFETKVLVLAKHGQRFMLFSNKSPSKLETSIHYLDIKSIESPSVKELKLAYGENKAVRLTSVSAEDIDGIIAQICTQLKTVFPLLPVTSLIPKVDLSPADRNKMLQKKLDSTIVNDLSACSGFSRMYVCMCELYGLSIVEEIIWDLDTIYLSQDSRTLYLRDFDHLSLSDHIPLLGALQYNEWFNGVDACNMKMTNEALAEILKVVKRNTSISEWNLASVGLRSDFIQKFSTSLASNVTSKIVSLNLSGNAIEDKGLSYLSEAIATMVHGMQSLNISQCSITVKGINRLMDGVSKNHIMANTLHTLNLSGNNLKGDELVGLHTFLAQPNVLQKLNLSDTDIPLDVLFSALCRGSVQHMEYLDVSGNFFTAKKTKELKLASSWKQFFSSILVLTKLNLSNTKLPAQAMKEMLLGLSTNVNKPSVYLDLSSNEMRSEGGMVLGGCVANLSNIHGMDLSDNGLDANLHDILPWFGKNGTIHHLSIGKNFAQLRNKALQHALDALVSAIQDEHCALESLSIADSKLRLDTTVVINALGSNSTLKSLDVSGNQMGDIGAKMLGKALTINSTLTNVLWDRNGITSAGLRDVAQSLQRNFTMLEMPLPIFDIAICSKMNPDIIHSASMQIQSCLQRNHAPRRMAFDQCYRLQQGFIVNSAQSIIDKKVHEIHSLMNSLCETDNLSPEEFSETNKLLSDADRAKKILMSLQTVAIKCEEAPNLFTECVVEVIALLDSAVNTQLDRTRKDMLATVGSECLTVLADKDTKSVLDSGAQTRGQLKQSEISALIEKHLVNDITSKVSSLNFNVAFYIAEAVIDKIVELLNNKHNELKSMKQGSGDGKGDDEVSLAPSEDTISSDMGMTYLGDSSGNRLSVMNTLKRRPQSVLVHSKAADANNDFNQEMRTESFNILELDESDYAASSKRTTGSTTPNAAAEPVLHNLPEVGAAPALKHLNKDRPKRAKKQAARRPIPAVASTTITPESAETDAVVDDFFKPASVSQTPVVVAIPTAKPRAGSKLDKSDARPEKPDDSPKLKQKPSKSPFGGSNKDKQDTDKKKGSRNSGTKGIIASGISNFFKKKKTEKAVDQPDSKTESAASLSTKQSPTPTSKSRTSANIPEKPVKVAVESAEETPSGDAAAKSSSLERGTTPDAMSSSTMSESEKSDVTSKEQAAPVPAPKRRPMGVGLPGMSGGLLAEMQAKRTTMQQPALQPKATPRIPSTKPAMEESPSSPPFRPQPPVLKPTTPVSELKKEESLPPARPSPPKPTAAPRTDTFSTSSSTPAAAASAAPPTAKPAKPPALRPKPPKISPKPAPSRPQTMIEVSARSPGAAKSAPPKPPPPDISKRQTYVDSKLKSPVLASPTTANSSNIEVQSDINPGLNSRDLDTQLKSRDLSSPMSAITEDTKTSSGESVDVTSPVIPDPPKRARKGSKATPTSEAEPGNPVLGKPVEQSVELKQEVDESPKETSKVGSEDDPVMKSSSSHGDLIESSESTTDPVSAPEVVRREPLNSTSSRDSITEELKVTLRDGSRRSSARLSNGSVNQDKRLSTPTQQLAHIEDGPVLRPPPPKVEKRLTAEQDAAVKGDSGDESMV